MNHETGELTYAEGELSTWLDEQPRAPGPIIGAVMVEEGVAFMSSRRSRICELAGDAWTREIEAEVLAWLKLVPDEDEVE